MSTATHIDTTIAALLEEWGARRFQWGLTDCCQFARAAAWRLHGIAVDTPAYINEREAVRALEGLGGYIGLMRLAKLHQRPVQAARRGDFAVFEHPGPGLFDRGLALVTGTHAHAPTTTGLIGIARGRWIEVWGVA